MSLLWSRKAKGAVGSGRRRKWRKGPDNRTWIMRRTNMLARLYAARLGETASDPIVASAIRRASELEALGR
jgi:hypothetical protein